MHAVTTNDQSTRAIDVIVTDGPELDITQHWHTRPRIIRVERMRIVLSDGHRSLSVSGHIRRKDGTPGLQEDRASWTSGRGDLGAIPAPLSRIFAEATEGVAEWHLP